MKLTRNYLKGEEIAFIVDEVLKKDTAVEREILKEGLIAQFLCDKIVNVEDNFDIYNELIENGIELVNEVTNYCFLDKIIAQELSVNNTIKGFVERFEEKFSNDLKNFNTEKILGELIKLKEDI